MDLPVAVDRVAFANQFRMMLDVNDLRNSGAEFRGDAEILRLSAPLLAIGFCLTLLLPEQESIWLGNAGIFVNWRLGSVQSRSVEL
jgi:hypothetical protein